ncbi:MAG TPA: hypothetical protein VNM35_01050 [Chitinophagaceae bacterium]|nr:hypothetical protein [Chitinophagaceae bacterium]
MKRLFIIFLFFNSSVFSQQIEYLRIYNDTSLYFIHQIDSLNPVTLSPVELVEIEEHLVRAINEFNRSQQRYADSVNPKNKKRRYLVNRIDINQYFFQIVPTYNKQHQKQVRISGDSKGYFIAGGTKKRPVFDKSWKKKFIDGDLVADGGAGFIYLIVNLTLKDHDDLTMNGSG